MQYLQLRSGNSGPPFVGDNNGDTLLWDDARKAWYVGPGGGGGAVSSVFGRTGAVVAATGDYDGDQVDNVSTVPGSSVSDALDYLLANAGAVSSVFGRTGAVVAATGDYDGDQVDNVSTVPGSSVSDALEYLLANAGAVSSVFGRTGAVAAAANDYTAQQVAGALYPVADVAARNAIPAPNRQIGQTIYTVATDQLFRLYGGITNGDWVDVTVSEVTNLRAGIVPAVGAVSTILQSTGTASQWVAPLTWDSTFISPTIQQQATGSATGQKLTVRGQNALTTGGALELGTGTGATVPGELALFAGLTKFGSFQLSDANDYLALGLAPALVGALRLPRGATGIKHRDTVSGSLNLNVYSTGAADNIQTYGDAAASATKVNGSSSGGVGLQTGGTDRLSIGQTVLSVNVAALTCTAGAAGTGFTESITNTNSGSNAGGFWRIRAMGSTSGNTNGASVELEGGKGNGTGLSGGLKAKLNADDTQANMSILLQLAQVATGRRVLSLCFPGTAGAGITTTQMPANTGDLVVFVGDAPTLPSANAAGGFIFYSDGARPAWRYNGVNLRFDGVQTTVGAAGAAAPLPALPLGYKVETISGVATATPYYAAA